MLLHISNDFCGSKVYTHLVASLHELNCKQLVYTATSKNISTPKNIEVPVVHSKILSWYTRVNFFYKSRVIYQDLLSRVNINDVKLVHAHTWYSDGAIALKLYKEFGIPYVISIRNSDINVFYPYFIHLRNLGYEILANAKHIIFISSAHCKRIYSSIKIKTQAPISVIPNGVDPFWLENVTNIGEVHKPFKFIYVGKFDHGKNVCRLIDAVLELNKKFQSCKCQLILVGGGGDDMTRVMKRVSDNSNHISYLGIVKDKEKLKDIYRSCDAFAMPSLAETFGLVYVEAMTQGLPVLYSKDEGIDGFFDSHYGISCNPHSKRDIMRGLWKIINYYQNFEINSDRLRKDFNWILISQNLKENVYKLLD